MLKISAGQAHSAGRAAEGTCPRPDLTATNSKSVKTAATIDTVITAVKAGELDELLAQQAKPREAPKAKRALEGWGMETDILVPNGTDYVARWSSAFRCPVADNRAGMRCVFLSARLQVRRLRILRFRLYSLPKALQVHRHFA